MNQWFYTLIYLLMESYSARRDAKIRFLKAENRILRSRIKSQRIIITPEERSKLMNIGAEMGHRVQDMITIVQYRTYQRWLKEIKVGRQAGRAGRPRKIGIDVRQVIARLARENPSWGYLRIVGELLKLRCKVGKTTVRRILHEEGIYPEPTNSRLNRDDFQPWDTFLKLHMNTLVACDFFVKNIHAPFGKRQGYVLVFMHLASRKVWVSPATYHPNEQWVKQQARNVLMSLEDVGIEARYLIHDRDTKFSEAFDSIFRSSGIDVIQTPVRAPDCNAYVESWVASIKRECLNHFLCFSLSHLDHIVQTYAEFYNTHRPHQSKGNRTLNFQNRVKEPAVDDQLSPMGKIGCTSQLGGLLKSYHRIAA